MEWPPQGTAVFAFKKPCCVCPVDCVFLIPSQVYPDFPDNAPYADLDAATTAMGIQVTDCICFSEVKVDLLSDVRSASVVSGVLQYTEDISDEDEASGFPAGSTDVKLTLRPGLLTIALSLSIDYDPDDIFGDERTSFSFSIKDNTGAPITGDTVFVDDPGGGTHTFTFNILDAGNYVIHADASSEAGTVFSASFEATISSAGGDVVPCPIQFAYLDDDDLTQYLDCS